MPDKYPIMTSKTQNPARVDAVYPAPQKPPHPSMVWIPGGTFEMGSNDHYPEEAPVHSVTVDGFWMDKYPVTNARFGHFVRATGYVTVAERRPDPAQYPGAPAENLGPGSLVFRLTSGPVDLRHIDQWWAWTPRACWRRPEGPGPACRSARPRVSCWRRMRSVLSWVFRCFQATFFSRPQSRTNTQS